MGKPIFIISLPLTYTKKDFDTWKKISGDLNKDYNTIVHFMDIDKILFRVFSDHEIEPIELEELKLATGVNKKPEMGQVHIHPKDQLNKKEIKICQYISDGLTSKEIGAKIFLSKRTVENHKKSIFDKVGVNNAAQLIVKAIKLGYVKI